MLVNKIAAQIATQAAHIKGSSNRVIVKIQGNTMNIVDVLDELRAIQQKAQEIDEWAIALSELK